MLDDTLEGRLTKMRLVQGLTQKAVAKGVGVSTRSVSNWETGARRPRLAHGRKWAAFFGLGLVQDDLGCRHLVQLEVLSRG